MEETENESKFDTCANRSRNLEEIGERTCCSDNRSTGYICWELDIEDVKPEHCENCLFYKKRKTL